MSNNNNPQNRFSTASSALGAVLMAGAASCGVQTTSLNGNSNFLQTQSNPESFIDVTSNKRRRDNYSPVLLNSNNESVVERYNNVFKSQNNSDDTKVSSSINLPTFNLPKHYLPNLLVFREDLEDNLSNNEYNMDLEIIKEVANYAASKIAFIECDDRILELSSDGSIKFTLMLKDNMMLMINKPSANYPDADVNDILFSVFENKTLIYADTADLDEFVSWNNLS